MSDDPGKLQFETAESASPAAPAACSACRQPIAGSYFTVAGQMACERCKSEVERSFRQTPGIAGFARAIVLGSLAGAVGAAVWYGIRATTGFELGLIAIAVGFLVGTAVKQGSGGHGGPVFQALAVALTYFWIAANYVPDIASSMHESAAAEASAGDAAADAELVGPVFAVAVVVTALALPFLMGFENVIGILIIGFALFEAWRINKRVALPVAGPFTLGHAKSAAIG